METNRGMSFAVQYQGLLRL